jgi:pimeloyl-ACP methyl ester carboxylesterase
MKQIRINAILTNAALALTVILILTVLPRASTAAPRLKQQPLESLSALNTTETTERRAPLSAFSAPSAASVVQPSGTTTRISAALRSNPVMLIETVGQFNERACFQPEAGLAAFRGDMAEANAPAIEWRTVIGAPDFNDVAGGVCQTLDGGYALVGWTSSKGAGSYDAWLIRMNSAGNVLWDQTFGGSDGDFACWVEKASDGGFVIGGSTASYTTQSGVAPWVLITDAHGTEQWQAVLVDDGDGYSIGSGQCTSDGGYVLVGKRVSVYSDGYVVKAENSGRPQWSKILGAWNEVKDVQELEDGGFIIAGGRCPTYGMCRAHLAKLDALGNVVWDHAIWPGSLETSATSVQVTPDGGFILAGGAGCFTCTYWWSQIWLAKVDPAGEVEWQTLFEGGRTANDVQLTLDNGFIIVGTAADDKGVVIKTDSTGNVQWEMALDDVRTARAILPTRDGGYLFLGNTRDVASSGYNDIVVVKLGGRPTPKPPVVLVHGWAGLGIPFVHGNTCTDTPTRVYPGTNRFFGNLPQWLYDLDYTEIYEVNLTTGPGYTPLFEENAECLRRQLESVTGGTRKAILIAHSMGGLVSRAYMENENLYGKDVARLITLGSPHAGINWEFLIKILLGLKAPDAVAAYCFIDPGTCQLSTEQVLLFDLKHNSRVPGVPYDLIGGRKTPFPLGWLFFPTDGPNDGLVGLASATGKTYWTDLKVVDGKFVSRYQTNETHCPMVGHPHYFEGDAGETRSCIRYLLGGSSTGGSCVQATAMMAQAQAPAIAYSLDVRGHITSTQTVTHSLQVDADGASLFYLSWVTGTLGITLTNPVGTVIDPAYAAANTDVVTYTTSPGSEMTPPFAAYAFTTTVPGLYTATVTAGDVGITGTDYLLFAAMETTRTLSVALDSDHYQIGDTAVLTATLEGAGGGITGATVQATFSRSDTITDTLTLTDQGDGTYRGTYAVPNAPGYLHLRVTAEGSDAGTQFSRQVDRLLTVASQAVQLTGTYSDRADDADGNGRYETLTVDVEVLAAGAGDFTFSTDLVTGGDQFVAHVITQTALITGTQSVPLRFDGELIHEGGSDGPFTVTNLLISDPQNAGIPSVMADDVWTTAAYDHTQFGRITGDLDGNCVVNIVDIMLVASRWNTSIGDIRYDAAYDLDKDGDIDVADIMFVATHWREKCE